MRYFALFLLIPASIFAQNKVAASPGGLTPTWDVRKQMTSLAEQVKRLPPILDKVNPKDWVAQGAPETYIKQLESAKNSVVHLVASSGRLAQDPEKLTAALDTLFRFDTVMVVLGSLRDGVRKYQGEALSSELNTALTDSFNSRETLKQHVSDLANLREQELQLMDQEAQRCRGMITRTTPPSPAAKPLKSRNRSKEKKL